MNTAESFFGYLCGAVILGVFSWIGIALRIAYTKMDLMLRHLKNSSVVTHLTQLRKGGPWGKLLLVGSISGIVTFPGFYVKRGRVCLDDLSTFPILLKRKLVVLQWGGIVLFSLGFVMWLLGKSIGWLE